MEAFFSAQMLKALSEGDAPRFVAWLVVFFILWRELRGLKNEVKHLAESVAKSFADGNARFSTIEARLTVLEKSPRGLHHEAISTS